MNDWQLRVALVIAGALLIAYIYFDYKKKKKRKQENEKLKKIQKELRTKNVAVVTDQAWTEMYVLPGGVKLDTSTEDLSDVQVGAKKGELKRAFGKMTSGRKNQRPLLNKFIGMIA